MNLNKKLILESMTLVIVTLMITAILFTILINQQFNNYITDTHTESLNRLVLDISSKLQEESDLSFEEIGLFAVSEGYYLEVLDGQGMTVYMTQNMKATNMMGQQMTLIQMKNMPAFSGIEVISSIISTSREEFLLNIAYLDDGRLSREARKFRETIFYAIGFTLFIALIIAFFISRKTAKYLSKEIRNVTDSATGIIKGNMSVNLSEVGKTNEINQLNQSINTMAKTLSEQESLRRELVETVNHEVKTPLTVLKSQIDAFIDGVYIPNEERLEKCRDEIIRLEVLMERMDDYDTFNESKYVLNVTEFSLREELEAIKVILLPQFEKKKISIEMLFNINKDNKDARDRVKLDRHKFRQIMYNLLSNAYKFSNENTIIKIKVDGFYKVNSGLNQPLKECFNIEIENKGLAIKEDDYNKIFDAHYRSQNANKLDPHGKGLGLKISKNLVEFMKGSIILVQSDSEKTVFKITLPTEF